MPSYELLGPWIDRTRQQLQRVEWADKVPKLFWRGGMRSFNSCPCPIDKLFWPPAWQRYNFSRFLSTRHVAPGGCHDLAEGVCEEAMRLPQSCRCHRRLTN